MDQSEVSAHLATFPPRAALLREQMPELRKAFRTIHICLNEYTSVPEFLQGDEGVKPFIPATDQKDVGKFAVRNDGAEFVCLIDDDVRFPANFVRRMLGHWSVVGGGVVGLHGIDYLPEYRGGAAGRRIIGFWDGCSRYQAVDALATNSLLLRGSDMPTHAYMADSQKFVDVRFAHHCAERGLPMICVPRSPRWVRGVDSGSETIFDTFTRKDNPALQQEVDDIRRLLSRAERPRFDTVAIKARGIILADPASIALHALRRIVAKSLRGVARSPNHQLPLRR